MRKFPSFIAFRKVLKGKTLILNRHRNKTYGLWDIPISIPVSHPATEIITKDKTNT